ncbi:MAG: 1,4-alpha-glucan-branching enzyme [Salinivirgaceae bacterium]|nr:MAG: 1,4-alpha-glucan-branching enzyme [Salinivirgaceae bacterium]
MIKPGIVQKDPWLEPFQEKIIYRNQKYLNKLAWINEQFGSIKEFASAHHSYGLHKTKNGWVFRENAPNAAAIYLIGDFNNWEKSEVYQLKSIGFNNWEISLPEKAIKHLDKYKLLIEWEGGSGERLPAYVDYVVQDEETKIFSAQVWAPGKTYQWKHKSPNTKDRAPYVYESHVGMATEEERVGTYREFADEVLPRIKKAGYSAVQLMAVQEHPYYGSFGYHVSNYFAPSSRFGTPDDLKYLIDTAHGMGLAVIMDIVHSHAVKNENEGLGRFDGTTYQYFHDGYRREHAAWDSLCFDYNKTEPLRLLLSNCRYWIEEFNFDGYRFDGVTSMLYLDHGLERSFTSYDQYFDEGEDEDAITYLMLANHVIKETNPNTFTIAEDMSGMPGLAAPLEEGGYGFDFRLAMGIPDYWIKLIKEYPDEQWPVGSIYHELTNKRPEEKTIAYAESHDQALVGDKTIIFRLIDKQMYWHMDKASVNLEVDRGMALHKMIRLITLATSGDGYLNFMGNEFGHPEWIDFPREGNNWSYKYARRQWSLCKNKKLRYHYLSDFDKTMLEVCRKEKILMQDYCNHIHDHESDQVLIFSRGNLFFVFNFNPTQSFTDYGFKVPAGDYKMVLNTDNKHFGGFANVDESIIYKAQQLPEAKSDDPHYLKLYIPSRTGMVLKHTGNS